MKNLLAIDIGSYKTTAVIANFEDELSISGVGIAKSKGIKKGAITNIDEASKAIKQAYNDAKRVAGVDVKRAIVSISSAYTKSITSYGVVNIPGNDITINEIKRAIETAAFHNANIPHDYQVLQVIPYEFKVDDLSEIEDPAGMSGTRLEVSLHIVCAQKSGLENLKKTLKRAGLEIENIVAAPYASSLSVLKDDEKELGVALIDIGATTSDLAIFVNSAFRYTDFLGVGSHHITNDLSMALHTPLSDAEYIKVNFEEFVKEEKDLIEISVIGADNEKQKASLTTITQIISARIEETFLLLNKEIDDSRLKHQIGAGIVLTGGFTNFYNIRDIASGFFDGLPVRVGEPKEIDGLFENLKAPEFSCVIGLLLYGIKEGLTYEIDSNRVFRSRYTQELQSQSIPEVGENLQTDDNKKDEEKEELVDTIFPAQNEKKGIFSKFKNWMRNLF
ncbi:MAG: cell division protein FtsA [Epsilonproteobacteria bacterium]|nr:cell division protein FtsA [Campylobacterota bacterium]